MANRLYQPLLNVIKFQELSPVLIPQYISKHLDQWIFEQTVREWEAPTVFKQLWGINDSVRLQFESNYQPIVLKLFTCDGTEKYSQNLEQRQQNEFNPDFYLRHGEIDLITFVPGDYYFTLTAGGTPLSLVSEPFKVSENIDKTLYFQFSHHETKGGIRFNSPFSPEIRIPGYLKYNDTGSKDVLYEDEPLNEQLISSTPYRIWDLFIGGEKGIPPYLADKVKRIMGCSSVRIDGKYYTKNESSKWEKFEEADYPMQGWKIEVREKYNRDSLIYENDVEIMGIAAAGLIVNTKGFGMNDNSGDDYLEIDSLI